MSKVIKLGGKNGDAIVYTNPKQVIYSILEDKIPDVVEKQINSVFFNERKQNNKHYDKIIDVINYIMMMCRNKEGHKIQKNIWYDLKKNVKLGTDENLLSEKEKFDAMIKIMKFVLPEQKAIATHNINHNIDEKTHKQPELVQKILNDKK